jgi:hypothetical protein
VKELLVLIIIGWMDHRTGLDTEKKGYLRLLGMELKLSDTDPNKIDVHF